jgi:hypothetical protein
MADRSRDEAARYWFWSSPERNRLEGAITQLRIQLGQTSEVARRGDWWTNANAHLAQASIYLGARNYHQGWISLQAAQREMLLDPDDPDALQRAAIQLRCDLERVSGRRARAITDLICDAKGELRTDIYSDPLRSRVIDALAVRDDQHETDYFKIMLRRRHLFLLFVLLLLGIGTCLALSAVGALPAPFDRFGLMVGVVLFGVLGAALSVARGLLVADISAKIPAQQIGAFMIWMRPAIGAAAALIAFVLLNAKVFKMFDWDHESPTIIYTVAIVAGFSERFIVGAIERIADGDESDSGKKKANKQKDKDDRSKKGKEAEQSA